MKDAPLCLNSFQQNALDVFRIMAALSVVIGHSFSYYQLTIFKNEQYFPYIQNIGVVVFFLLSGFLTTFSIARKNSTHKYTFKEFFIHKFFRINKEYIPGLIFIGIIDCFSIIINKDLYPYYSAFNIEQFIANAFMLQNMGPHAILSQYFIPFGSGRPLWTLSIEWWLYMLFGFIFLYVTNKRKLTFVPFCALVFIVFMISGHLVSGRGNGLGVVFALGILGYYSYQSIGYRCAKVIFPSTVALYIIYGFMVKNAYTKISFVILALMLISLLRIGLNTKYKGGRNKILAFISKSTFMLYLLHYSIIDLIFRSNAFNDLYVNFIMGIVISSTLSCFIYYVLIEKNVAGNFIDKMKTHI